MESETLDKGKTILGRLVLSSTETSEKSVPDAFLKLLLEDKGQKHLSMDSHLLLVNSCPMGC